MNGAEVFRPLTRIAVGVGTAPSDLIDEMLRPEHLVHKAPQVVPTRGITMEPEGARVGEQLTDQQESLKHELQIRIVSPDVGVLDLLAQRVSLAVQPGGAGGPTEGHLPDVISAGIERWVDVDEVYLAPKSFCEEVAKHFLIVPMKEQTAVRVAGGPVLPSLRADYAVLWC